MKKSKVSKLMSLVLVSVMVISGCNANVSKPSMFLVKEYIKLELVS